MSTPKLSSQPALILSVSRDAVLLATRNAVLRQAGYDVATTMHDEEAIAILKSTDIDAVVLGDSIGSAERNELARAIKQIDAQLPIIILKRTGEYPPAEATAFMDSLEGPETLLRMLEDVLRAGAAQAA
jgi:DNA-binding NtrC family response regulator